ncbi:DEAD/DEAH box helicase [bacterium SCSIO 12741]|nr:DEAD/DEAH box helicase [bacterium SCSIO 12741]
MDTQFKPGTLVSFYEREWVVQPSQNDDVLLLKPLGGSEKEIKGIYKNLFDEWSLVKRASLSLPQEHSIGSFASARLLCDAARLSFRSGAGPFRSMGRLSFEPRSYQLVPLIMALRQQTIRLLIADDVGIGKTIEALMIVREKLDRGEIQRFAIICLPHLCDQWHQELKDKFGIDATLIRSGTVKKLERELGPNESLFEHYPFQVISIDYIKGERKREVFLNHVPEMVVVDEAHTCAQPSGATSNQQQRHRLLKAISQKEKQHLLLLTATPHSGKQEEFQSLLGLLDPSFEPVDITQAKPSFKKEIAQHFVQRRRKNVEKWMDEKTPFPTRLPLEQAYILSPAYRAVFRQVLQLARMLTKPQKNTTEGQKRMRYFLAIGLIRGVMSSPATGETMLQNRLLKSLSQEQLENLGDEDISALSDHSILDGDFDHSEDQAPAEWTQRTGFTSSEQKAVLQLGKAVSLLKGWEHDQKATAARDVLKKWLRTDNTIVFCRYIQTANYLGELLQKEWKRIGGKKVEVAIITSELSDEERKERVHQLSQNPDTRKVIVATDCMSEGINLQEHFSAVIHYDLPWNPNRLEQREGRVDRFGQSKDEVKALLLYGQDNPMDGTVLEVLLRKARKIRQAIGISVPFPDDSKSIMDAVLTAVLLKPQKNADESVQTQLNFGQDDEVQKIKHQVSESFERMEEQEKQITSIFAQNSIKPNELAPYLWESKEALGDAGTVEQLVKAAMPLFGCSLKPLEKGFELNSQNLPVDLKESLPHPSNCRLSFASPTPNSYTYIGRNHPFVEQLCLKLLDGALNDSENPLVARASVFRSKQVEQRTTLFLLRIRNVIANKKGKNELVAEEMKLWGYEGLPHQFDPDQQLKALELLQNIQPSQNVPDNIRKQQLNIALRDYQQLKNTLDKLARERAQHMVTGHEQFRKAVTGHQYQSVIPVLPPDVLGVYIILPEITP